MSEGNSSDFDRIEKACADRGVAAMCDELAASLGARGRWHAVFDLRTVQARLSLGLPSSGHVADADEATRAKLDDLTLAACREVGWPLLEAGQVAAAWMYLRAAVSPSDVAAKLKLLADSAIAALQVQPDDEDASRRIEEILGVVLWESADPALGIRLILATQGTCNAITAYEQAVSRLPAVRQDPAAARLVAHLHDEVVRALVSDLAARGIDTTSAVSDEMPLQALLEAAGGLVGDGSIHVDVSHLQSVLRIARVCADQTTLRRCYELAAYGCRLPEEVTYPGEPPFENVAEASRYFYGAQIGRDEPEALAYFRRQAAMADPDVAGSLPLDTLMLLLTRLGRKAEALREAINRPHESRPPSTLQAAGLLPSLVELAQDSGQWDMLLDACRRHGDEVTYVAALAAKQGASEPP
jgi:hypothetical protein